MKNPKFSIIIPVYNAELYLTRCIDSVLNQSFSDFELLLIDDGSKDKSLEICNAYILKDNRVCVFHKQNGGVSSARNVGIENAKGEYIIFIDSDDYIDVDYLMKLTGHKEDLVLCGNKNVGSVVSEFHYPDLYVPYDSIAKILEQMIASTPIGVPWGKVFNARIINEYMLRFDESMFVGEDHVFVQNYLIYCKSLRFISWSGYNYWNDNCIHSYRMNEVQASNFLTKILETFYKLRCRFQFNNEQFISQNYFFAINQYLSYQSFEYKFSFNTFSKSKDFLKSISSIEIPSMYAKTRGSKLLLYLLEHRNYSFIIVLWRFIMPLYKFFR